MKFNLILLTTFVLAIIGISQSFLISSNHAEDKSMKFGATGNDDDYDDDDGSTAVTTNAPTVALISTNSPTVAGDDDDDDDDDNIPATESPTPAPAPTRRPTRLPTLRPTRYPSPYPSMETASPSRHHRSRNPTYYPTSDDANSPAPSMETAPPTHAEGTPTEEPTPRPTFKPSVAETNHPSDFPTPLPTPYPSRAPTITPTLYPTVRPTRSWKSIYPTPDPTPSKTSAPTHVEIILTDKEIFGFDVGSRAANIMTLIALVLVVIWLALSTAYCITRGYNNPRQHGRASQGRGGGGRGAGSTPGSKSRRQKFEEYWGEIDDSTNSVTSLRPGDNAPTGVSEYDVENRSPLRADGEVLQRPPAAIVMSPLQPTPSSFAQPAPASPAQSLSPVQSVASEAESFATFPPPDETTIDGANK